MKSHAEVVIIGAGVIGTSIAWQLAKAGCRDVVILERSHICSGSSSKGVGGFRQQFSTEIDVRLSQITLPILLEIADEIDLHQNGYMYLALNEQEWQQIQARAKRQQAWDVPVELLSTDEVAYRWGFLNTSDVYGAAYCPKDGLARPPLATAAFAKRARELGVEIVEQAEVIAFERSAGGDRITALQTSQGRISAEKVVIAAGPQSGAVGALAGIDLPVKPMRRQAFHTGPSQAAPSTAPLTIDETTGFHFRPDGDGQLLAMSNNEPLGEENLTVDYEFGARMLTFARHRLPQLTVEKVATGRAGLYEMTPDAHPVLGAVPGLEGLYCACGFSGHGFMHSGATGILMAELLTTGKTSTLDISPFSITRFAEGKLLGDGKVL